VSLQEIVMAARRIRETSVAELAAVPKVTPKLAQRIFDHFNPPAREPQSTGDCYNAESLPAQEGGDST